jgi:hypothetical protein
LGRAGPLDRILERAFEEIAACPVLLSLNCELLDGHADVEVKNSITGQVRHSQVILRDLEQQFSPIACGDAPPLAGPEFTTFVAKIARLSAEEIRLSLALLEQLEDLLYRETHFMPLLRPFTDSW